MIPLIFIPSITYAILPLGPRLNFAIPVAAVLTGGDRVLPDKLATKLVCCANTGVDINDMAKIQSDIIGAYLPIGNFTNRFVFRDISIDNRAESISLLLNIVKLS